jgi:hypothetical protein
MCNESPYHRRKTKNLTSLFHTCNNYESIMSTNYINMIVPVNCSTVPFFLARPLHSVSRRENCLIIRAWHMLIIQTFLIGKIV